MIKKSLCAVLISMRVLSEAIQAFLYAFVFGMRLSIIGASDP